MHLFFLVFNFINVQEILELFRSAPYSTSTAAHRSKITDQVGGGSIFRTILNKWREKTETKVTTTANRSED